MKLITVTLNKPAIKIRINVNRISYYYATNKGRTKILLGREDHFVLVTETAEELDRLIANDR